MLDNGEWVRIKKKGAVEKGTDPMEVANPDCAAYTTLKKELEIMKKKIAKLQIRLKARSKAVETSTSSSALHDSSEPSASSTN